MSKSNLIPQPVQWNGAAPSQERLVSRGRSLHDMRQKAIDEVDTLMREQKRMGEGLADELHKLKAESETLQALDQADGQGGLLAVLTRRLTRRSRMLERKSHTLALIQLYEEVGVDLRRAATFTDELKLCALSLNSEVESLVAEKVRNEDNAARSGRRILALQEALAASTGGDAVADQLRFELRQELANLALCEKAVALHAEALPEARELRDQVQGLQERMQEFVTTAAAQVDASGRRIQALGAAADAPMVVAELKESLEHLETAMELTSDTVIAASRLLDRTLPDLHAKLGAEAELDALAGPDVLSPADLDEKAAREAAEKALKRAADAEIESLSGKRL